MMRLTHMRLLVTRFDECLRFYRDVLGLELVWGEEGARYADFKAGDGSLLALFRRELIAQTVGRDEQPVNPPGQDRAMLIFAVDDLATVVDRLGDARVELVAGPVDRPEWGIRVVHLRDPDDNLIELNSPLPKEQWTAFLREADDRFRG